MLLGTLVSPSSFSMPLTCLPARWGHVAVQQDPLADGGSWCHARSASGMLSIGGTSFGSVHNARWVSCLETALLPLTMPEGRKQAEKEKTTLKEGGDVWYW